MGHLMLHERRKASDDDEISISDIAGPFAWGIIHHVAESFPCPPCAEHGAKIMRMAHDFVNWQLGKPLFDRANFLDIGHQVAAAVEMVEGPRRQGMAHVQQEIEELIAGLDQGASEIPVCTKAQLAKRERCIQEVKDRGDADPFAVCTASVACRP